MRKITIILILQILVLQILVAQDIKEKFGKVSIENLKTISFEKDKEAEAYVIFDFAHSYFKEGKVGFDVVFHRTTRIKILDEAGIDFAEIEVPYYVSNKGEEKVYDLEATIYNLEDGNINHTYFEGDDYFDEKYSEHIVLRKFVLPKVKEGTVIEYSYKVRSPYIFRLRDWEFQWDIPVEHSEYQVNLIPFYKYTWLLQGANTFSYKNSRQATGLKRQFYTVKFHDMIHNYVMKDVPAFRDEKFITSRNDYIMKMDWQLIKTINTEGTETDYLSTWPKMIKSRLKNESFGKYIKKSAKSAAKFIDVASLKNKPEKERFNEIMNYVKDNYTWNRINSSYTSNSFKEFSVEKEGNSANINLFTIGLLQEAGLEAKAVISSTRSHGIIKYDYPFVHFFNYALIVVKIDGEEYLADATNPFLSNDRIPEKSVNDKGLVITDGDPRWLKLTSSMPSETSFIFDVSFEDGETKANVKAQFSEYDAAKKRKYTNNESKKINDLLLGADDEIDDESIKITNLDNIEEDLILEFTSKRDEEFTADKIFFSPFFDEIMDEYPLKQKTRKYPIDLVYPKKRSYKTIMTIPEGYKVDYVLKDYKNIDNDYFSLTYAVKETEGKISIELSYYFKKYIYPATAYGRIKYYYKEVVKLGAEKVVFVKIDGEE